jgi:hypothetical protein
MAEKFSLEGTSGSHTAEVQGPGGGGGGGGYSPYSKVFAIWLVSTTLKS